MNKISKFLPYFIFHILIGLFGCAFIAFWFTVKENLLPPFMFGWQFRKAILLFIFYFPFIVVSALIMGYTIIFGKYGPFSMPRRSSLMMKFIQSFFIIILSLAITYVVLCEVVRPIIQEKQETSLQDTVTYIEYKKRAEEAFNRKEYKKALSHIKRSLLVWPKSETSLKIQERIKIAFEENSSLNNNLEYSEEGKDNFVVNSEYSPLEAFKTAEKAMLIFDCYTAHYYAKLAFNTFDKDNPLKVEAEKLATRAWDQIKKGFVTHFDQPEIERFNKKKLAYEALQSGNYIKAYYSFLDIHSQLILKNNKKLDPEVERFLEVSKVNLLKNVFFLDEIDHIPNFKVNQNISFLMNAKEHIYMDIYAISRVATKTEKAIYLLNVKIQKKIWNSVKWSINVPYAKIIEKDINGKKQLLLQVKAFDRFNKNEYTEPVLEKGSFPIENTYNMILPFSITEFNLIEEASLYPTKMKLASIYSFIFLAEKFGFNPVVYIREIIFRLAEPLLFLIVSIVAIIISWRLRLMPGKKFRKSWIFATPLCPFLAYLLIEFSRYLCKLQIALFVSLTPFYSPYIILGILILCFIVITTVLFFQRSE